MINFSQNPYNPKPASDKQIKKAESQLNMVLPHAHKTLLKQTNGCFVGGDALLYGTEDIAERNATWEVHHYANGYVAIGDDGGGQVFLMRQTEEEKRKTRMDCGRWCDGPSVCRVGDGKLVGMGEWRMHR
ncbi:SMI1/KNR4 family protein [Bacillus pumilus]|uniref:SMI1/KNR4 family protein n=1 Tax=Bacillus pumilus TaxID=1408 RepID=UPI0034D404DB